MTTMQWTALETLSDGTRDKTLTGLSIKFLITFVRLPIRNYPSKKFKSIFASFVVDSIENRDNLQKKKRKSMTSGPSLVLGVLLFNGVLRGNCDKMACFKTKDSVNYTVTA